MAAHRGRRRGCSCAVRWRPGRVALVARVLRPGRAWRRTPGRRAAPAAVGTVRRRGHPADRSRPARAGRRSRRRSAGGRHLELRAFGGSARRLRTRLAGEQLVGRGSVRPPSGPAPAGCAPPHRRRRSSVTRVTFVGDGIAAGPLRQPRAPAPRPRRPDDGSDRPQPVPRLRGRRRPRPATASWSTPSARPAWRHLSAVSGQNVALLLAVVVAGAAPPAGTAPAGPATLGLIGVVRACSPGSSRRCCGRASWRRWPRPPSSPAARRGRWRILGLTVTIVLLRRSAAGPLGRLVALGRRHGRHRRSWPRRWRRACPDPPSAARSAVDDGGRAAGRGAGHLAVFGPLPLASIPANLLAVPAAGPVMVYGLPAGLAGRLPARTPWPRRCSSRPRAGPVHRPRRGSTAAGWPLPQPGCARAWSPARSSSPWCSDGLRGTGGRVAAMRLALGDAEFDVTYRALVMGILNRTPDSFYDAGRYFDFDDFLATGRRARGRRRRSSSTWAASRPARARRWASEEELERVVPAVEALRGPVRPPDLGRHLALVACSTPRSTAGASRRQRHQRLRRSRTTSPVAARHGASVVATHIRLAPRVPDPAPDYPEGVVEAVVRFCADLGRAPRRPASRPNGSWSTPASTSGKTEPMSLELLRASDRLAALGYPVLLSASNKRFLGEMLGLTWSTIGGWRPSAAHAPGHRPRLPGAAGARRAGEPAGGRRDGRRSWSARDGPALGGAA